MTTPLLSALVKLLNSTDFTPHTHHADVRVTDLRGAATALGEIQQIVEWLQRQVEEGAINVNSQNT